MSKDEDGSGLAGYAENRHVFITKDFCKEGESQFYNNDLAEKLREINERPGIVFVKMRKKNGDCALVTQFEKDHIKLNMLEIRLGLENYYAPAAIIPSENVIAEYAGIEKLLSAGWNYDGYIEPSNEKEM